MKTMSIIGIILSAYMIIVCLGMITEEGIALIFATYAFFLAFSIVALRNNK